MSHPCATPARLTPACLTPARLAQAWAPAGRFARHYVAGKLRHDPLVPALRALGAAAPLGHVLDLGCGRGQFAGLLLAERLATHVTGIERRPALLAQAAAALAAPLFAGGFTALAGDLTAGRPLPAADTVLLIDVLYQLPAAARPGLLGRAAATGARRLLLRTPDPGLRGRARLARLTEALARPFWPHGGSYAAPPPPGELRAALHALGFTTAVAPSHRGTPFANILLIATRDPPLGGSHGSEASHASP